MVERTIDPTGPRGDRAIWREAVRDVRPLPGRAAAISAATDLPAASAPLQAERQVRQATEPASLDSFAGVDRATSERLKRGLHKIEARLDLHGMTQVEAHRALDIFVKTSREAGRRCVLVITGRGLGPNGPGVLKSTVPRWLAEPQLRRQVLAIAPARPIHGGAGAIYLLLRRRR